MFKRSAAPNRISILSDNPVAEDLAAKTAINFS